MPYHFGDYEFDPDRRVLLRGATPVRLEPKVFDLLLFLILHRARVVPKATLVRELWPDSYVTTASLTRLVKEARRAVGDDGRRQRVIQTVHRIGYRFVAAVRSREERTNEGERAIEFARRSLEASIERGGRDLRARISDFAETCLRAVQTARGTARE